MSTTSPDFWQEIGASVWAIPSDPQQRYADIMNINDFSGAKLAILTKGHVLTLLRDDRPDIPFPNMWDLPGGARDGQETPLTCALRETFEEARLRLSETDIVWKRIYPSAHPGALADWFFVATPGWLTLPPVQLGDEGQEIAWMQVEAFLALDTAVPHLKSRLTDYLNDGPVPDQRPKRVA